MSGWFDIYSVIHLTLVSPLQTGGSTSWDFTNPCTCRGSDCWAWKNTQMFGNNVVIFQVVLYVFLLSYRSDDFGE